MNKRQLKKAVMRNVSKHYDLVFEQGRFQKNIAIVCGRSPWGERTLTTMLIKNQKFDFNPYEPVEMSLDGYVLDHKST